MEKSIVLKRFTFLSLLKIVAVGCSISLLIFGLLMGIFAIFGAQTVHWNREVVVGIKGLFAGCAMGIYLAVAFTFIAWIGFFVSFWIFSHFRSLKLTYVVGPESSERGSTPAPAP